MALPSRRDVNGTWSNRRSISGSRRREVDRLTDKNCNCHTNLRFIGLVLLLGAIRWRLTDLTFQPTGTQCAYIGPGAGIALIGSFLAIFTAILSAIGVMLTWPIRRLWRAVRSRQAMGGAKVRRVVVLGLDGLEPSLTEKFIDEGLLPGHRAGRFVYGRSDCRAAGDYQIFR